MQVGDVDSDLSDVWKPWLATVTKVVLENGQ